MIKSAVARTPILAFILMFFALGYTVAHNKVVVVPLGADAGVSGHEIVTDSRINSTSPGFFMGLTVSCPPGKSVIGGGAANASSAFVTHASYPDTDTTWFGRAVNISSGFASNTITVYAICANTIN